MFKLNYNIYTIYVIRESSFKHHLDVSGKLSATLSEDDSFTLTLFTLFVLLDINLTLINSVE